MFRIRKLGVSTIASIAVLGVVGVAGFSGAASASAATLICSTNQTDTAPACLGGGYEFGTDIAAGDTITGTLASDSPRGAGASQAVLTSSAGTIKCDTSTVTAALKSDGTSGTNGGITGLNFGSCSGALEGNLCSVTSVTSLQQPWNATATAVTGQAWDGELVIDNPDVTVALNCVIIGTVNCTFTANSVTGQLYNPGNVNKPSADSEAVADFNAVALNGSGAPCPTTATFSATYDLTGNNGGGDVSIQSS